MNPNLAKLQPYPFERLRALLAGAAPPAGLAHVNLSIGEPKHATPEFIERALVEHLGGLASYPLTAGTASLREAIARGGSGALALQAFRMLFDVLVVLGRAESLGRIADQSGVAF